MKERKAKFTVYSPQHQAMMSVIIENDDEFGIYSLPSRSGYISKMEIKDKPGLRSSRGSGG